MRLPVTRRRAVGALSIAAALGPAFVRGQSPKPVPRLGLLIAETASGQRARMDALLDGLRERGYVDGRNLAIDVRAAEGDYDRLPALASDLVRTPVNVIVAFGIKALVAAREATTTLPIVIPSTSSDPVAMGLIDNLSRQRGNITGSVAVGPHIMAKRLELLKEIVPTLARVAVLVNPANASFGPMFARMERTAKMRGLTLVRTGVAAPSELENAIDAEVRAGTRAIVVQDDTMFAVHAKAVADFAARRRLATAGSTAIAEAGALIGYGAADLALYRRGAYFIERILKGAKPSDLPIEQATRFDLVVNLRTARAIGITVPSAVLMRSDTVIE